jgi:two-component system cell cycle sensor histidine kinase/response regulator CckA
MEINFNNPVERFSFISILTGQLIYDYNITTGKIDWFGPIKAITGYERQWFQSAVTIEGWASLIHPDDRENSLDLLESASENHAQYSTTYRFRKSDQTYIYIEDVGSFFYDESGQSIRMLGVMKDITEIRRAQKMLVRSERLKSVAELSAGVSHNFNNVLQTIIGCTQIAILELEKDNKEETINLLKKILDSCHTGARTVSRLQSFSCVKEDSPVSCEQVIDVSETIKKCIEMSQPKWKTIPEKRGIYIDLVKFLPDGLSVKMEESDLIEVIVNLTNNAVDAMPLGGQLSFKTYLDEEFNAVAIEVSDTGTGIADVNKSYIFEPFWTTKGKEGTGLGLASSFGIISSYKGSINLESSEGNGTTFRILLPRAEEPATQEVYIDTVVISRSLKILIIDDQEILAEMYARGLEILGHETYYATSGIEGLPLFYNQHPDVVVCDLTMPEMNGWQVGRVIQEYATKYGIRKPVFVMLTGWGISDELEEIEKAGVDVVLQKPVELKTIVSEIDRAMKESNA